jgi:predicted HAD superfamily Cof-like phosphohydrolase
MNDYNPMKALKEFHDTFAPDQRTDDPEVKIDRRMELIREEYHEVMDALSFLDRTEYNETSYTTEEAMVEVASELADLLYVVYGTAEEFGIPLDKVFIAIHQANMRKVWDDGTVHRNGYGKVIKPPNHQKADIRKVLYGELDEAEAGGGDSTSHSGLAE